jgi:hypothetical protein
MASDNYDQVKELLRIIDQTAYRLDFTAEPERRKVLKREIAAAMNSLAAMVGLRPIALGGTPLDEDDNTTTTIGEIPT